MIFNFIRYDESQFPQLHHFLQGLLVCLIRDFTSSSTSTSHWFFVSNFSHLDLVYSNRSFPQRPSIYHVLIHHPSEMIHLSNLHLLNLIEIVYNHSSLGSWLNQPFGRVLQQKRSVLGTLGSFEFEYLDDFWTPIAWFVTHPVSKVQDLCHSRLKTYHYYSLC